MSDEIQPCDCMRKKKQVIADALDGLMHRMNVIPDTIHDMLVDKVRLMNEKQDLNDSMKVIEVMVKQEVQGAETSEGKKVFTNAEQRDAETFKRLSEDSRYQKLQMRSNEVESLLKEKDAEVDVLRLKFRAAEASLEKLKMDIELWKGW